LSARQHLADDQNEWTQFFCTYLQCCQPHKGNDICVLLLQSDILRRLKVGQRTKNDTEYTQQIFIWKSTFR
jgi:hypothetical protein